MVIPGSISPRTVWTPQPGVRSSQSLRHPGRIKSHPRITNPSIHLQLQQTGDEKCDAPGPYRPTRCGNPNPGFVEPASPGEDKVSSSDDKSFHTSTTPTKRGITGGPPGRYRPARRVNANLGYVEPAPPGEDNFPSTGHKSFHTSTVQRGRTRDEW